MRERITRLAASAFRGVPGSYEVLLDHGQSLVVLGENGTGKSTLADIVEYFFTGGIEFLRKEGRGHTIRHVGAGAALKTEVVVETTGSLGGRLEYPVPHGSAPGKRTQAETFLLRGRTLAEFIEKSKGEKWAALSHILGLEEVDNLRLNLQTAAHNLDRAADTAASDARSAARALEAQSILGTGDGILNALKSLCGKAGVAEPPTLEVALSPSWSATIGVQLSRPENVGRSALAVELTVLPRYEADLDRLQEWNDFVAKEVTGDEARVRLLTAGRAVLEREGTVDVCPLCGQPVDNAELRRLIADTLSTLQAAAEELTKAEAAGKAVAAELNASVARYTQVVKRASQLKVELPPLPQSPSETLGELIAHRTRIDPVMLESFAEQLEHWREGASPLLDVSAPSAGDTKESPLFRLGVVVELARRWNECQTKAVQARKAAVLADELFTSYQDEQRTYFGSVLEQISDRAARIYAKLHAGEGLGSIIVEPMSDKGVELVVDFHGTRQKPPHGVLSESHLNSLAIALFLAMAETFNQHVGFMVLDDVVNSFDIPHRGQLADLLASEYKEWQLLVLTHDEQFYRRITRRAPDWSRLEFTSWSYEDGPRSALYQTADMAAAARRSLADHDRIGAATKGRRAIEEFLQEVCEGLKAPLPFRRGVDNDRREIGELMKGLRRRLSDHKPSYSGLKPLLSGIEADVDAALNVEAHASQGRAAEAEVAAALDRLTELINYFTCSDCHRRVWDRGDDQVCSCRCGRITYPPRPDTEPSK